MASGSAQTVLAKVPDRYPPYESPPDLRFPLHFALCSSTPAIFMVGLTDEEEEALKALKDDFYSHGHPNQKIELETAHFGPDHPEQRSRTPKYFSLMVQWYRDEPNTHDVDFEKLYWSVMELIEKHFPKEKFWELKHPWLYPPVIRIDFRECECVSLCD